MKIRRVVITVLLASLVLAACGDDDEGDTSASGSGSEAAAGGDAQGYCDASAALDETEGMPTDDQFEELAELAPEEIKDDVELVVERFKDVGPDAFMEGEVNQAIERIEEYEVDACGREPDDDEGAAPQEPDPDATEVQVTATDYDFDIEGDVPAGKVAFVMQNDGDEPHHMSVIRFKDGTTQEEAEAAADEGFSAIESLMDEDLGESSDAAPGETAVLNAEVTPGVYGMACFASAPDGQPHIAKGMRAFFTAS